MARIVVFGSANVDYVVPVRQLPSPGETVLGGDLVTVFGGKGANQAVAAARLGGRVDFVGKLGADPSGDSYLSHLGESGVGITHVLRSAERPSGCALILVEEKGQNVIVVAPGANAALTPEDAEAALPIIREADLVLVQFEIPQETVRRVIRLANEAGRRVMVNPSPVNGEFRLEGLWVDYLVLNTVEAQAMAGEEGEDEGAMKRAAEELAAQGAEHVILTRGDKPTLLLSPNGIESVPTFSVTPVDTVGAGDTFAGALAVAIGEKMPLPEGVRFANCAAAIATTKLGAQTSMPMRSEVETALRSEREVTQEA